MAYNTKKMLEDSNGDLIPQYFNQQADAYEHLRGKDGVNFVGNHVLTDSGIWVPQRGTEDGAAHTQLTGSILANDYLLGIEVSPGNFVDTPIINFRGTRIGIGVRFEFAGPRIDFEVSFEPSGKSISSVDSSQSHVLIDKTNDYRGTASLVLNTPRGRFRILNKSDESATLEGLTVTEFMASGNGGTNE